MKHPALMALLVLFCCAWNPDSVSAQNNVREHLEEIAIIDQKVMMPMRDGIRLATDIYRPKTDEPVPVIFSRTPYNFNSWGDGERRTRTAQRARAAVKKG
jgi:predicted acyl esterase